MSLTIPVKWFPGRKGLVTGIAAAGFGLGAIALSALAEFVLQMDKDIFYLFRVIGIVYEIGNLGIIYPYVFIGYAIAGIAGPLTGGLLSDYYGNYTNAVLLASAISLAGGLLFLFHHIQSGKKYART